MLSIMPPATRAGQTGRDERDDDQVTTAAGNGQEEGWLMQVVRILQLTNLALTAEEAIVWVMGLVTISNQTPQKEMEKIPKDVLSSIAHIKKLSDSNWHTWEPTVRGLAPETQVDLSRYSVTVELCDSYCLGIGDYRVVQWRSLYMGFG